MGEEKRGRKTNIKDRAAEIWWRFRPWIFMGRNGAGATFSLSNIVSSLSLCATMMMMMMTRSVSPFPCKSSSSSFFPVPSEEEEEEGSAAA